MLFHYRNCDVYPFGIVPAKTTLETSEEDVKTTLQTSGEDVKTTLGTGGEDVKMLADFESAMQFSQNMEMSTIKVQCSTLISSVFLVSFTPVSSVVLVFFTLVSSVVLVSFTLVLSVVIVSFTLVSSVVFQGLSKPISEDDFLRAFKGEHFKKEGMFALRRWQSTEPQGS
jgi:hypothetical protein